jgi:hypothetical protein
VKWRDVLAVTGQCNAGLEPVDVEENDRRSTTCKRIDCVRIHEIRYADSLEYGIFLNGHHDARKYQKLKIVTFATRQAPIFPQVGTVSLSVNIWIVPLVINLVIPMI